MFFVTCVIYSILFCILRCGLECNGQEQYSFRQHVVEGQYYLQIFYTSDGTTENGEWYNIRHNEIDYRELYYACTNISSEEAMVEYEIIDDDDDFDEFEIDCDNLPPFIEDCNTLRPRGTGEVIDLTCLDYTGYNERDVRQLEDGRIIQLVDFGNGRLVWAHFCYRGNDDWDNNVANLACQSLGFEGVKDGMEKMEVQNTLAYGLIDIDCTGVMLFSNCMSNVRNDNDNRCMGEDVIALTCENFTQSSTQMSSTISPSTTNIPLNTQTSIGTVSSSDDLQINPSVSPSNMPEQTVTNTSPSITTTQNPQNRQQDNLAAIISVIASAILLIIILFVIVFIIALCCIVKKRKKNLDNNSNTNDDEVPNYNMRSTTNLTDPDHTLHTYTSPGQLLSGSFSQSGQNGGNIYEMSPSDNGQEMYYETPMTELQEDIYSSLIYESDQVVPNFTDRKYHEINHTTEEALENLYLQPNDELPCFIYQNDPVFWQPEDTEGGIYSQMAEKRYREINPSLLIKDEQLGQGNFGFVHSGIWNSKKGRIPVAIKSLKMENKETSITFLQEAAILGQFTHPNVLKLLGVVTLSNPLMMVTELLTSGLQEYLNKVKMSGNTQIHPLGKNLVRFTTDIALGMQYLASKKFIHRDLAARNILVSQKLSCKIGDFGLARMAKDNDYYVSSGGLIPLRWTAPEAIFYKKYSEKSDVWSYGVTLYEIWSLGRIPWDKFTTEEVVENISQLRLLSPPTGCPRFIYELMVSCWNPNRDPRPSFQEILQRINSNKSKMLWRGNQKVEELNLGLDPILSKFLFIDLQNLYK